MNISPYVIIPLLSIVIGQAVKVFRSRPVRRLEFRNLFDFRSSSLWLLVAASSLLVITVLIDGLDTPLLAGQLLILAIVYHQELRSQNTSLRDRLIALAIGSSSGTIFSVGYWHQSVDSQWRIPGSSESMFYLIIFAVVLLLSELLYLRTRRASIRKLPTSRQLRRTYRLTLTTPAFIGLVVALLQNQTSNEVFTNRIYTTICFVWIGVASLWAFFAVYRDAGRRLSEEAEHFAKQHKKLKKKRRSHPKRGKK